MPRGDGTGPAGNGAVTVNGLGRGGQSLGRGRMGAQGAGIGNFYVCPGCGDKVEHRTGIPCIEIKCPKCGIPMLRGN